MFYTCSTHFLHFSRGPSSILVPKFETFHDLVQSGIPLAVPKGTIIDKMLSTDPRPTVQRMYRNSIGFLYAGGNYPRWIGDK